MNRLSRFGTALIALVPLAACQPNANKLAMDLTKPPVTTIDLRQLESRQYSAPNEGMLLGGATQTLQDLGFTISESESTVGVVAASKHRDATETGQVVGALVLAALFGAGAAVWDTDQTINVSVVTKPIEGSNQFELRVAFDRVIRNNKGQSRGELVQDAAIYQEFFDKLSAGTALEGQKL